MPTLLLCVFAAAPPAVSVRVTVDTSEVPEVAAWGRDAKRLVEKWHPVIGRLLASDGFTPPGDVRIVFKKDMKGVAFASGRTITIAAKWVKDHPDDYGMVVHELTHVVQSYRRGGPGWLVEGIADYVRFAHYEPGTRVVVNRKRASYRDGYRTAGKFLAWAEATHDEELVRTLNAALRAGRYEDGLFKARTGKTLDELWAAFLAAQERR
ncbi:MAG: basic secretory protein-like protein [Gemmataceae bacterium]